MPEKRGNGGHGLEEFDPITGKYVEDGQPNSYYNNPDEKAATNSSPDGGLEDDYEFDENLFNFNDLFEKDRYPQYNRIIGKHSIEDDCMAVNMWSEDGSEFKRLYANNCANCVIAFEFRRRGYDVEAKPVSDLMYNLRDKNGVCRAMYDPDDDITTLPDWGPHWTKLKTNRRENVQEELLNAIVENGDWKEGARFFVRCGWSSKDGHVFNAEIRKGDIVFIEAQSGRILTDREMQFRVQMALPSEWYVIRVDNKEFKSEYEGRESYERPLEIACRNK